MLDLVEVEPTTIEFPSWSGEWEIVGTIGVLREAEVCPSANLADISGGDKEVVGDEVGDAGEDIEGLDVSLGVVIVVTRVELSAESSEARGDT